MSKFFRYLAAFAAFLPGLVSADLATVHLADGRSMTVDLVLVDQGQVQWKNPANPAAAMQTFLRSQVEYVDFPPTGLWKSAEADFQSGNIAAAIEGYQAVLANRDEHFYPMPGNFVSLALVRLLEIRRIQLNAKAVAEQFQRVRGEWVNLPPDYRKLDPVTAAWISVSEEKWEEALGHLEKVESPGPETFYLRGRSAEALGRSDEAIQHYAGAYILNFGGFAEITKQSLRRSIELLAAADDKNRRAELQAQAKLYRDLLGKGKLWADAPEWVVELAGAEIETAKADIDGADMEKPVSDGGTVVEAGATSATLPPQDERDWILASETDRKIYLMTAPDAEIENLGGVKETGEGYEFDGTGGGLKITGINGPSKMWIVKAIFTPQEKDGALFDVNGGKHGGLGFYLREGKLMAVWNPARGKIAMVDAGPIELGKPNTLYFRINPKNELLVRLGELEPVEVQADRRGLGLGANLAAVVGDTRSVEGDEFTADGKAYTPFKGVVSYFALGFGADGKALGEGEKAQFGGKRVVVRPPEEAPAEEPAAGEKMPPAEKEEPEEKAEE